MGADCRKLGHDLFVWRTMTSAYLENKAFKKWFMFHILSHFEVKLSSFYKFLNCFFFLSASVPRLDYSCCCTLGSGSWHTEHTAGSHALLKWAGQWDLAKMSEVSQCGQSLDPRWCAGVWKKERFCLAKRWSAQMFLQLS